LSLPADVAVAAGGSGTAHTAENDGRVTNASKPIVKRLFSFRRLT